MLSADGEERSWSEPVPVQREAIGPKRLGRGNFSRLAATGPVTFPRQLC